VLYLDSVVDELELELEREKCNYWDKFYSQPLAINENKAPTNPSNFAKYLVRKKWLEGTGLFLDLGCGNLRDSLYFSHMGFDVLAIDQSVLSVDQGRSNLKIVSADISDPSAGLFSSLPSHDGSRAFYARFVIHALTASERRGFYESIRGGLRAGDRLFLEFRTLKDKALHKVFPEHFRQYLEPAQISSECEDLGFKVIYKIEGSHLARYKTERPFVCRMILEYVK